MEAKDTVMKFPEEVKPYHWTDTYTVGDEHIRVNEEIWEIPKLLNAQAEISFKAGKEEGIQEGRQEVVALIRHFGVGYALSDNVLKEWGI